MTPDHFFILKISNWYLLFFITTIINIAIKEYRIYIQALGFQENKYHTNNHLLENNAWLYVFRYEITFVQSVYKKIYTTNNIWFFKL